MVCLAIVTVAAQLVDWITSLLYLNEKIPIQLLIVFQIFEAIPSILFISQFVKLYCVQIQLKTSDENTVVIMQKLSRAKYMVRFVVFFFSIDWISDFSLTYNDYLTDQASPIIYNTLAIINALSDGIYATFFTVLMIKVNMQLASFF